MKPKLNRENWKYKKKLRKIINTCIYIPMIILCIFIVIYFYNSYKFNIGAASEKFIEMQENQIHNNMNIMSDKTTYVIISDEFNEVFKSDDLTDFDVLYKRILKFNKMLDRFFLSHENLKPVLYTSNKNIYQGKYIEKLNDNALDELKEETQNGEFHIKFEQINNKPCFSLMRQYSYSDKNFVILKISKEFSDFFSDYDFDMKYSIVLENKKTGEIVYNTEEEETKELYQRYADNKQISRTVIKCDDYFDDYTVYNFLDFTDLKNQMYILVITYMLILILLAIAINILVSRIVEMMTKRLSNVVSDMLLSDINSGILLKSDVYDEFEIIEKSVDKYKKEIISYNEKLIEYELKQLSNRVSPHFLYNILSAVRHDITDKKIYVTLDYLIAYYRKVFHHSETFITIEDELENILLYVDLLKYAYRCDFDFEIIYDAAQKKQLIISDIIQPLVENAFIHGINLISGMYGQIILEFKNADGKLIIEVKDNADLMDFDKINDVIKNSQKADSALKIINEKLKLYYGDSYRFDFLKKNDFSVCYIEIPQKNKEEQI